jgi:hypothetical protein
MIPLRLKQAPRLCPLVLCAGLFLSSCGGGSSVGAPILQFASAGDIVYMARWNSSSSGGALTDPTTGASVSIPGKAFPSGTQVSLTTWSSQRAVANVRGWDATPNAVDVAIDPSKLDGKFNLTVSIPWRQSDQDAIATMLVAFAPNGRTMVLGDAPSFDPAHPSALLSAAELQVLLGSESGIQTVEIAVEQQTSTPAASIEHSSFVRLYTRPDRTAYASKKRIAIVLAGAMDWDATNIQGLVQQQTYLTPLLSFLAKPLPQEGNSGKTTPPFDPDEVWAFNYDYNQSVASLGIALASAIAAHIDSDGSNWSDSGKAEIHVIAYSMGEMVARWAIEQQQAPSVVQLITLGGPHQGIPLVGLKTLDWLYALQGSTLSLLSPGIRDLADASNAIHTLEGDPARAGVQYEMIAGDNPMSFGSPSYLPEAINAVYSVSAPAAFNSNDGLVPVYSALGGPGTPSKPVAFNHSQLLSDVSIYWAQVASSWLSGINRDVESIDLPVGPVSLNIGASKQVSSVLLDKGGSIIDPQLLSVGDSLVWTTDNPMVATVSPVDAGAGSVSGVVTAVGPGTCHIIVKDSITGASQILAVNVVAGPS